MKRTTLLAVAAFAALLAIVMLTRVKDVNEGVPKLVLQPMTGDITGIELTGPTPASLKLENGAWTVSGHVAEDTQVKTLIDSLKDFHANDFVTEKTEKQPEYEVDDAKGTKVAFTTSTGPGWTLVFGKAPKSGGTYVRDAKSNAIFITKSPLAYQVKKGASSWRKKNIATAAAADITKVTVTQPDSVLTLVKNGESWTLSPPPAADFRFDPAAAQKLVQQLSGLNAQDFSDEPVTPVATIDVETKEAKKLQLHLGAKNAAGTVPVSLEGDPQTYLLPGWVGDALTKKVSDMRDLTLMAFDATKVEKLSITAGGKTTVVAKDGASWKVVEPKSLPAGFQFDPNAVGTQIGRLRGLRAQKVASDITEAKAGFAKPVAVAELTFEGGKKQQLKLGGENEAKQLYAKGSADSLVYAVGVNEKATFEQGLELFKKRAPPDMSKMRGLDQLPPDVRRQLEAQMRAQQH